MKFSIALATTTDSWRTVKRAEELGFENAWFYDTQLLVPDVFVGMALAAHETSRIGLGTGVLIPSNRLSTVTANGLASLNKIAPGRIRFGVGTGFTGRRTMDLKAIKMQDLENYLDEVTGLLNGETVPAKIEGEDRRVRFLNPEIELIDIKNPIPLYLAGEGPRTRALTRKLNAGWIYWYGTYGKTLDAVTEMNMEWSETAPQESSCHSTVFTLGAVLDPGEPMDCDKAMNQAGPKAALIFHHLAEYYIQKLDEADENTKKYIEAVYLPGPEDERHLRNHRGHLLFVREEEKPFITADLIEKYTFTGTREILIDRLRKLEQAGVSEFVIQLVNGHEEAIEEWAELFSEIKRKV